MRLSWLDEEDVMPKRPSVGKGSRYSNGGCLGCDRDHTTVVTITLGNTSVRVCPACAREVSDAIRKVLR